MTQEAACSFCEVEPTGELVANDDNTARICRACVALCADVFKEVEVERKRTHSHGIRVNEQISAETVDVIDAGKNMWRGVSLPEAIKRAKDVGLSLVEINSHATPPVCRIMQWPQSRRPT